MRSEAEVRERLAGELVMYAGFENKDSVPARAAWERIRILEWALTEATPPPEARPARRRTNGNGKTGQAR